MSSLQFKVRQVPCKSLKSLCVRSASGVVRQVRQVNCKSLILLYVGLRQVCVHCVPHTPYTLRAPLGRRASVMKGGNSPAQKGGAVALAYSIVRTELWRLPARCRGTAGDGVEVKVTVRSYPCNKTIPVTTARDKITPSMNVAGIAKLRISTRSALNPDFILFLLYRTWRDMITSNCADSLCFKRTTAQVAVAGVSSAHGVGGGGWCPSGAMGAPPLPPWGWMVVGSLLGSPARRVLRQRGVSLAEDFKTCLT